MEGIINLPQKAKVEENGKIKHQSYRFHLLIAYLSDGKDTNCMFSFEANTKL